MRTPTRLLLLLTLVVVTVFAGGCARRYDITLNNSDTITAHSRPVLNPMGFYEFKDAMGKPATVSAGRVRQIETR